MVGVAVGVNVCVGVAVGVDVRVGVVVGDDVRVGVGVGVGVDVAVFVSVGPTIVVTVSAISATVESSSFDCPDTFSLLDDSSTGEVRVVCSGTIVFVMFAI